MPSPSNPPEVLGGRYKLGGRLARGGMADIVLAEDEVLQRQVVIKMLLPQYATDPAFIERFRREAKSAARLNHANVVAVYDWGSHDETWFMAMEYIEGQSLAQLLQAEGKLSVSRAVQIAGEAAAGIGFAHENGMVHRDVKPGNIMLADSGPVKVADFGIAQAFDGSESLTQTGSVMGTAAYFSPEQARGEEVDPRSDLYSLGVVLFEMVTGERPFTGDSPLSVAYKHVGEEPPTPSTVNANLPPSVDAVIATLLSKDPDGRYFNATELRADLHRLGAGEHFPEALSAAAAVGPSTSTGTAPKSGGPDRASSPQPSPDATRPMANPGPSPSADRRAPTSGRVYDERRRNGGNGTLVMALGLLLAAIVLSFVVVRGLANSDQPVAEGLIRVPTVTGESEQSASNEIRNSNLVVRIRREESQTVAQGLVISQDPGAQTEVEPEQVVILVVSSGDGSEPESGDRSDEQQSTTTSSDRASSTARPTTTSTSESTPSSTGPTTGSTTTSTGSTTTEATTTTTESPTSESTATTTGSTTSSSEEPSTSITSDVSTTS